MTTIQPEYRKLLTISIVLSLVLFILIELLFHIPPKLMFLKVGFILTFNATIWVVFEKWAWRWYLIRKIKLFKLPPDLNGRWEGTLQRVGEPDPHHFAVEITQTYSTIRINAYSKHSHSHSLTAALLTDENNSHCTLVYTWLCSTTNVFPKGTTLDFYGSSIVEVNKNIRNSRILKDSYFTGRNPQTRGTNELRWVEFTLYNSFEKI